MFEQRTFIAADVEQEIELYALENLLQPMASPASSANIGFELPAPVTIALFGIAILAVLASAG